MFDAWISNQDRHNENWAMIIDKYGNKSLAPSFDHAASLGRNESDVKRKARLETTDKGQKIATYVRKCKSYFYNEGKRLKTFEAFTLFAMLYGEAAIEWLERLESITDKKIWGILLAIPEGTMSEVTKQFCFAMLRENRKILLDSRKLILRTIEIKKEHYRK